jgi:hypothetical protein
MTVLHRRLAALTLGLFGALALGLFGALALAGAYAERHRAPDQS